ncbi:MAG TPA: monofunctional biosynthetic peptidoglycan transglycosylase [Gemmatimonadota bacterium]|nr:monofunctional biosynthetic peptidoglycan transglycosylase [Gemmatimonadota bacterium]
MRTTFRLGFVVALIPVLYVGSAVIYFPAVLWHRYHPPGETALMEIRGREARAEGRDWDPRYEWVPITRISPHLGRAVLAGEDSRFYEHHGFDIEQIREAWEASRRGARLRGASTITQQTARNLYLSPSRNILRKSREALLAAWMELWLPKDRILELYLNIVELGPGLFGAEAAARAYFGRSAGGLTPDQAALLAATLPAPLARNPGSPSPGLYRRQWLILARMDRWYGDRPRIAREDQAPAGEERPSAAEVPGSAGAGGETGASPPDTRAAEPIDLPAVLETPVPVPEPPAQEPATPQPAPDTTRG